MGQQALVDQAGHRREPIVAAGRIVTTGKDRRRRVNRKATGQRAQPAEGPLAVRVEQLITPGERGIHRLLACGQITQADGREQDVVFESAEKVVRGQHSHPWSCQLERERHSVEAATISAIVRPFATVREKAGSTSRTRSRNNRIAGTRARSAVPSLRPQYPTRAGRRRTRVPL